MTRGLPSSLVHYGEALDRAIRRDLAIASMRRKRKRPLLILAAVVVIAAAGSGALGILSRDGSSITNPAAAAATLRRAAVALEPSPQTILHVDMTGSQTNPDGSSVAWRDEFWQEETPPYSRRQIETQPDGSTVESGDKGDNQQIFDPTTNTIYTDTSASTASAPAPAHRTYVVEAGRAPGTFIVRPAAGSAYSRTISSPQLKALRSHKLVLGMTITRPRNAKNPVVHLILMPAPRISSPQTKTTRPVDLPDPTSALFRDQILALLHSGGATVAGTRSIDGQDAIEIDSADKHHIYFVDRDSYRPIELVTTGDGGSVTLRFLTYQTLPLDSNAELLSLTAQHPSASVDQDPNHYRAAQARLFPHG